MTRSVLWSGAAIAAASGGRETAPFSVSGISIDTRTLRPGDLFVALVGDRDGHDFVAAALDAGAAGVLVHRADAVPAGAPAVVVADTLAGLQALGRAGRARFGGRVVAVTGSVGKTTTKEMLRLALSAYGSVHAAEASYNNHWGVPLTLARLPTDAAFCVAEIGMNNPGEIAPLARMAAPDVAVITNVAAAHIGHLGSLEAIADEKASILRGLVPGGVAVLPADSPMSARLRAAAIDARIVTFGRSATADIRALDEDAVLLNGARFHVPLAAPGTHLRANAAATIAALAALGLDPAPGAAALAGFRPLPGRGLQRTLGPITLLDESYNANGASVRAALAVLAGMAGTRRIAVLGDMLELGDHGPAEHAGLAPDVAASADLLYACGPLMRHLFDAVGAERRGALAEDSAALAPIVAASVQPGDAVLVKGSLGSKMRVIVSGLESKWPEEGHVLFNLARSFSDTVLLANLFRYITFRSGAACLTALFLSFVLGPIIIRWLRSVQRGGQPIRTDGPERHLIEKKGTPTMGGVLILSSLSISTLLWADLHNGFVWAVLLLTLGYGGIGFIDDYLKLSRRNTKGVSARGKLIAQLAMGLVCVISIMLMIRGPLGTGLTLPVFKDVLIPFGFAFPLVGMFVMLGASNAVNLTDGLDGLAIVPTIIAAGVFALIAYLVGNRVFADYLQLHPVPGVGELGVFLAALIGAGLGFLWFNAPPAAVFMGDTGSLALGGALGAVAVATKHEIVLAIVGGLFVVETVSVIVQVFWYKRTGRRVFLMAPLHHHYEKKGWSEPTIVIRFWIVSMILALVGLATLKIR